MKITLFVLALLSLGAAQAPQTPVLDALDKQALELALDAGAAANTACAALDSYKHYEKARALVNAQVKAKYPGYQLNWQTRRLEPAQGAK